MAVAVHIKPGSMSRADYDRMIDELKATGADEPEGRVSHTAYGEDGVEMLEVWESPEHFERHRPHLFEALQACGVGGGAVYIHPVHSEHPD